MSKYLLAIILVCNTSLGHTQCYVQKFRQNGFTVYEAHHEKVFINQDLENGLMQYDFSVLKIVYDQKPDSPVYSLECYYSTANLRRSDIVPRFIHFDFTDGSTMLLQAQTELPASNKDGGIAIRRFIYNLNHTDLGVLSIEQIKTAIIMDSRTEQRVTVNPYPQLLLEQISCLKSYVDNTQ